MTTLCSDRTRRDALLQGAATLFDLSGTGVFPTRELGSLGDDVAELRMDFEAVGGDFWKVLRDELERLKKESDGGRR